MAPLDNTAMIQQAIQLAIAPVFLLTGIASLLSVMANRLARIIDRARHFEGKWADLDDTALASARAEMINLERRRRLASWAINFCTFAALLVCTVIGTLFFEEFFRTDLKWVAGAEFIVAMISLMGGLGCFQREVYVATHTVSIDATQFDR
ncbi:MAG: DUF2721 domain-containing protein [Betaproteobacteria bacterium]|nr:DUF2721 domain-containing protein [Betaproteobacteria bacterium]